MSAWISTNAIASHTPDPAGRRGFTTSSSPLGIDLTVARLFVDGRCVLSPAVDGAHHRMRHREPPAATVAHTRERVQKAIDFALRLLDPGSQHFRMAISNMERLGAALNEITKMRQLMANTNQLEGGGAEVATQLTTCVFLEWACWAPLLSAYLRLLTS